MTDQRDQLETRAPAATGATRLPADRAFVVQLHAEATVAGERIVGRVERVMTGEAVHFASLDELLQFIGRALDAA